VPTKRGWRLLVLGMGLALFGRVLAIVELFALAAAALGLVTAALAYIRLRRLDLHLSRETNPQRATAGGFLAVDLKVTNRAPRSVTGLEMVDGVANRRRIDWEAALAASSAAGTVSRLSPGESVSIGYPLGTPRRGVVTVGPCATRTVDPFGATRRWGPNLAATPVIVWPRFESLVAPPPPGRRLGGHQEASVARSAEFGDFAGLRPYVHGDDLRRVHWPTVARTDELIIREDDAPQAWHCIVILDLRLSTHDSVTAEVAISAAAGIVSACVRDEVAVRLVTSGGWDSGLATGVDHLETILDALARVGADRASDLAAVAALVDPSVEPRTIILVSGIRNSSTGETARLDGMRRPGDSVGHVLVGADGSGGGADWVLSVSASSSFAQVWNARFNVAFDQTPVGR